MWRVEALQEPSVRPTVSGCRPSRAAAGSQQLAWPCRAPRGACPSPSPGAAAAQAATCQGDGRQVLLLRLLLLGGPWGIRHREGGGLRSSKSQGIWLVTRAKGGVGFRAWEEIERGQAGWLE